MAANTKNDLKRLEVKYVRDKAKARYPYGTQCAICSSEENLELHHFSSLTLLWEKWKLENAISIKDIDDVMFHRDTFIAEHEAQLYEEVVTLCNMHHQKLHSLYGIKPGLFTATKQKNWIVIQKNKAIKA